jgi:hypothetical protein
MLGLGVSSASQLGGTAFALENSILAAFKTRVLADSGVVEDYACLNLDVKDLIAEPAPFTTGLLEFYPGAAAAYSLRQLRRSVFPYAIRVRRSGDSLEKDIGFNSNGELDTNALLDFADGGDAWVAVWYDQSSNGNDAEQTSTALQPQIVSNGSVVTDNGLPAMSFDAQYFSVSAAATFAQPNTYFFVANNVSGSSDFLDGIGPSLRNLSDIVSGVHRMYAGVSFNSSFSVTNNQQFLRYSMFDGSNSEISVDGAIVQTGNVGAQDLNSNYILGSNLADIKMQEVVFYNSDQSANRTGIESNINDFYSIYS